MNASYDIDTENGISLHCYCGHIVSADIANNALAYADDPRFDPRHKIIVDARAAIELKATFTEVLVKSTTLLPLMNRFPDGTLIYVVVSSDDIFASAHLVRQVVEYLSGIEWQIVSSKEELMQHTGVDLDHIRSYMQTCDRSATPV